MVQRIKHGDIKISTKDGEITIVLELNININTNEITASASIPQPKEEEKDEWMIPEFNSTTKINFGKEAR